MRPKMKLVKVSELFEINHGSSLNLNRLQQVTNTVGINYVSSTAKNNGVSAVVEKLDQIEPYPSGLITVSVRGIILETFLQPKCFYTDSNIYTLTPKIDMSEQQKLFYCMCIKENKYKYSYERPVNKALKDILIPEVKEIPSWINDSDMSKFNNAWEPTLTIKTPELSTLQWKSFLYEELFTIKKGKRLSKKNMISGKTPLVGLTSNNNGITDHVEQEPIHKANTISINSNVEAFYHSYDYWASQDVNVLYPKLERFSRFNQYIALFLITIIKLEKHKFDYGRKWSFKRMEKSIISLPTTVQGNLDLDYMEHYIKTLNYSSVK